MTKKDAFDPKLPATRRQLLQLGSAGLGAGMFAAMPVGASLLSALPSSAAAAAAFVVPDEGRPQTCIWMGWPASTAIWGRSLLTKVQDDIARLARTVAKYQPVTLLASGTTNANNARTRIGVTSYPVTILSDIPVDDCWLRDTGPVFRVNGAGGLDCIGLNFNGWGNKQTWQRDGYVAERIAAKLGLPITHADIVGEGGGVIYDGDGTLIANESCWVNRNRNPGVTRADIEAELLYLYGASKMIWCPGIKSQDITDDHIDATASFVSPGKLVIHNPPANDTGVWAQDARKVLSILSAATDARGRRFNITLLNQPTTGRLQGPDALLSYINYLVLNHAVITVNFGDASTDSDTYAKLSALYPGRTVEMINLDSLYTGGGGIHCVTQQQPIA